LFQVLDDHLNLVSPAYGRRKGIAEDLTEGKFSFPVVHALRTHPRDAVLPAILRQRPQLDEVKRFAVERLRATGAFAHSDRSIERFREAALEEVARIETRLGPSGNGSEGADAIRAVLDRMRVATAHEAKPNRDSTSS
jgi:geranylgeranyl diphosphate synthase type 3